MKINLTIPNPVEYKLPVEINIGTWTCTVIIIESIDISCD